MGLLRMAARTAVVAGTATAVSNRVSRRQYGKWEQQAEQQEAQEAQQYAPPPPAAAEPATGMSEDAIQKLQQLAQLKEQGILTEQEFAEQKAKILNG